MSHFSLSFSLSQTHDEEAREQDNYIFDNFDQVDDASQRHDFDISLKREMRLDNSSKDLLNRLTEKNPQHRLKSIIALRRIAFFHNFNFDDVRHRKVRIFNSYEFNFSSSFHRYRQGN